MVPVISQFVWVSIVTRVFGVLTASAANISLTWNFCFFFRGMLMMIQGWFGLFQCYNFDRITKLTNVWKKEHRIMNQSKHENIQHLPCIVVLGRQLRYIHFPEQLNVSQALEQHVCLLVFFTFFFPHFLSVKKWVKWLACIKEIGWLVKMDAKQKKELRKKKYKKPHKEKYLMINKMHLQGMDPMHDLDRMQNEQYQQKKQKTFHSPIPSSRHALYSLIKNSFSVRKQKAYVRLVTNRGNINIELFCNKTPKTCDNFLQLCEMGRYTQSHVHRLIRQFMMQTGRQHRTGKEAHSDRSVWEKPFEDEFDESLRHDKRGMVSMANSGPNTNGSELYVVCVFFFKKNL